MTDTTARPREHLIAMIVATAIYGVALPFTAMAAMFSPMASDSGLNTGVWIFIISMFTLPLALIAAIVLGWIFYAVRLPRLTWAAILFPVLWIIPIGLSLFAH